MVRESESGFLAAILSSREWKRYISAPLQSAWFSLWTSHGYQTQDASHMCARPCSEASRCARGSLAYSLAIEELRREALRCAPLRRLRIRAGWQSLGFVASTWCTLDEEKENRSFREVSCSQRRDDWRRTRRDFFG